MTTNFGSQTNHSREKMKMSNSRNRLARGAHDPVRRDLLQFMAWSGLGLRATAGLRVQPASASPSAHCPRMGQAKVCILVFFADHRHNTKCSTPSRSLLWKSRESIFGRYAARREYDFSAPPSRVSHTTSFNRMVSRSSGGDSHAGGRKSRAECGRSKSNHL